MNFFEVVEGGAPGASPDTKRISLRIAGFFVGMNLGVRPLRNKDGSDGRTESKPHSLRHCFFL
jgi:hypothetical protein